MIFKIKLLIAITFIFSVFAVLFAVNQDFTKVELNEKSSENFQVTSDKILNSKLQKALDKAVKQMKIPGIHFRTNNNQLSRFWFYVLHDAVCKAHSFSVYSCYSLL